MSGRDEIITEFLAESRENLDQLDRDLVTLERDSHNQPVLASVFRTIHTIKGTCGFFDFHRLGAVAHAGENLLGALRDGKLHLTSEITSGLLAMVDAIRTMLAAIESTGAEAPTDYAALIQELNRLQEGKDCGASPAPQIEMPAEKRVGGLSESTIRVDVALLDKLMNLVGELVLARNQLLQLTSAHAEAALRGPSQRLNSITTELQQRVMKTRMQPIATICNRLPRLARDLAVACGKEVTLTMEGKETELDRSIIEAIKDPLTHLLRNAIDHGLEKRDERQKQGKPAAGHILLRAYHEGGQVNIEISDDGAGIDPARIKQKALERGLVERDQAAVLTEREVLQLIFLPGFSTAEKVTDVSGRGVGMDVVRTNIERIGGTVDIQSRPGLGTTIKIKIPLTLAIIASLLVTSGGDRYAIPQVSLLELVRLEGQRARRGIEYIHGAPVHRLRGNLLPLVYLNRELRMEAAAVDEQEVANIVVLQADGRTFGLVVDEINDTEEIVVKPLAKQLQAIPLYAGSTILGDGRVALILDVVGLAQSAGVVSEVRERTRSERNDRTAGAVATCQTLLLVAAGSQRRLVVPLSKVARLEEVALADVSRAGRFQAVHYRGAIMPLLRLSDVVPGLAAQLQALADPLQVVVCTNEARQVGLVVEHIIDIVETSLDIDTSISGPGLLGSAVIQQRLTDVLDVAAVLAALDPNSAQRPALAAVEV